MTVTERLRRLPDVRLITKEPMDKHTTFKIGGPAEIFAQPETIGSLVEIVRICKENNIKLTVLGGGSNVLVSDASIEGVVLHTGLLRNIEVHGNTITAEAGVTLSKLAETACQAELAGLAFAAGIPGTVGGALYMNAGAYDHTMGGICESVDILLDDTVMTVSSRDMNFNYRYSLLQDNCGIALSAVFKLRQGNRRQIKKETLELLEKRKAAQPLEYPSAGSVFKRPAGHYAGELIMNSGLKGISAGGAQVSEKHAGFIVNTGGATARDVLQLISHIQSAVNEKYGVWLEPEIRML
jgi:UDP-N-acetylmuramate dehydrogenase